MELDALRSGWTATPADTGRPSVQDDVAAARARVTALAQVMRRRDRAEVITALLLLPFFVWVAFDAESVVSRLGAIILVVSCLAIPLHMRRAARRHADPSAPLRAALEEELRWVRAQHRLLRTVAWWYLAPLGIGVVLLVGGGAGMLVRVGYTAVVAGLYVVLYRLNQRAADEEVAPRERELERLLASLAD